MRVSMWTSRVRLKYGRKLQVVRKAKTGWKSREIGFRNYVRINDFGLGKGQDVLIFGNSPGQCYCINLKLQKPHFH